MKEGSEMLIISDDPSVVEDALLMCEMRWQIRLAAWRYEPQEAGGPEF